MHFMIMHRHDPHTEAGELPPPELIARMGDFIGGYAKTGRFLDGAGLGASKTRTRLVFADGRSAIQHGPYRGERELPHALLLLRVKTRDEAIGWAERYGAILGTGEIELGKLNEPWDLGMMPEPPDAPLQILLIDKADAATEAGGRTAERTAALAALEAEMTSAGVLVRATRLEPSAKAKRLLFTKNDLRVVDGPFAETKELIGGFAVLDLTGTDEAIAMCRTYAEILGGTMEADLRVVVRD
ncbi:MAG: hypothetical protein JWP97_2828 [Labilithrix sp.]|nr:hypothetical protein [Labilithrix sp.]